MILFNTTYIIDLTTSPEPFLSWALNRYIPKSRTFPGIDRHILARIDNPADEGVISYALQFVAADEATLDRWEDASEELRRELVHLYDDGRILSFSTRMPVISPVEKIV